MRAYVLLGRVDDPEDCGGVIGLASSKKIAIESCEKFLNEIAPGDSKIKWRSMKKHTGTASKGDYLASFSMHFVNQYLELED